MTLSFLPDKELSRQFFAVFTLIKPKQNHEVIKILKGYLWRELLVCREPYDFIESYESRLRQLSNWSVDLNTYRLSQVYEEVL